MGEANPEDAHQTEAQSRLGPQGQGNPIEPLLSRAHGQDEKG